MMVNTGSVPVVPKTLTITDAMLQIVGAEKNDYLGMDLAAVGDLEPGVTHSSARRWIPR